MSGPLRRSTISRARVSHPRLGLLRLARIGFSLACISWLTAIASAESGGPLDWHERSELTGSWGGTRDALAERGIVPRASYTAGFWSNLRGGFETGTDYEGFAEWSLELDLERIAGWRGGAFEINWISYHGGLPSEDLVGPFQTQTVSGNEALANIRFYEIFVRQTWLEGRLELKLGQLAADSDFFASEFADSLMNGTFGFLGLGRGTVAPIYPLAAPGVHLRARTSDRHWETSFGVYTADPGEDVQSNIGFDYSFGEGATLLFEVRTNRRPFGLPGSFAAGVAGTTRDFESLDGAGIVNGSYGLFATVDQTLFEESPDTPGLGMFLRTYGGLQSSRNQVSWYVDMGWELTRPFAGRGDDVISIGLSYLRLSDDYVDKVRSEGEDVSRSEAVIELTYHFQVTGWLSLQPDLQFFFDPHFSRRDATVIGLRAVIEL